MIIQLHTEKGIIEKDTNYMTQEELEALGVVNLRRINELLTETSSKISHAKLVELVFLLAKELGYPK